MPQPESQQPQENQAPKERPLRGVFGGMAIPIGRIFGIRLGLDISWFIIFGLATWQLTELMTLKVPDAPFFLPLVSGVSASLLFFVSILLHEMGHSLVSIRLGVPVDSITLFIFGGMAKISREPDRPRDEFLIAIAGPLVSVALGCGMLLVRFFMADPTVDWQVLAAEIFFYLGFVNIALAVFNMIPAFPLDGGRIFRAMLWAIFDSFAKATRWAAMVGSFFGWFLIGSGILLLVNGGGTTINGIWFAVMGWFLLKAARASSLNATLQEKLGGVNAIHALDPAVISIPASMSIAQLIEEPVLKGGGRMFVVERGGLLVGTLILESLRLLPEEDWPYTSVQSRCQPLDSKLSVEPTKDLWDTLRFMEQTQREILPVMEEGQTLGFVTRERILAIMRNRMQFFKKKVK